MPLRPGLGLYCYQLTPTALPPVEYSGVAESLTFTTVAPGGSGTLEALIKLPDARLPRPELGIFARVALMDPSLGNAAAPPGAGVWVGEQSDPEYGYSQSDGEYLKISALGLGAALRDDPRVVTYTNQTPLQIISSEMSSRSAYLPIDADTSALFPDNPSSVFSPVYQGRNMEEVIADVCGLAGDYAWGTWPHPTHRDALGFPTGQLVIHPRVPSPLTAQYIASITAGDVVGWKVVPSQERCYNVISIGYNDPGHAPPVGTATYTDPRLAGSGAQGSAPFRRRVYYRDLTGVASVTAAQAQALATTYGGEYQNVSNTVELTLQGVRDAQGNPLPLWQVWADRWIFVPELAVRGQQLALSPTAAVNLFYIRQTRYSEDQTGQQQLVLTCDNWADLAAIALARLQLSADQVARLGQTTTGQKQALGAPATGQAGGTHNATGAGQTVGDVTQFAATLSQAPTSIIPIAVIEQTNVSGGSVGHSDLTSSGFLVFWVTAAAGKSTYTETYKTSGNCLVAVDAASGTFAHHCEGCEARHRRRHGCVPTAACPDCRKRATRRGLGLARAPHPVAPHAHQNGQGLTLHHHPESGDAPGRTALGITCPACGQQEAYNTALTSADADPRTPGNYPSRAEQARLIRALMAAHGLPLAN